MKAHFFIIFFSIFFLDSLSAQHKYFLSVSTAPTAQSVEAIRGITQSRLETKLLQLLTQNNIGAIGEHHPIIIYPKVEIEEEMIQEGIENLYFLSVVITLITKNVSSDMVYSTTSMLVKGNGNSQTKALNNAIAKMKVKSKAITTFLEVTEKRIVDYFNASCEQTMEQSKIFSDRQLFANALETLESIPLQASCYSDALALSKDIFEKIQKLACEQILRKSKAYFARGNYQAASNMIAQIRYGASCNQEINQLLIEIRKERNEKEERQAATNLILQLKEYEVELESIKNREEVFLNFSYISDYRQTLLHWLNMF